MKNSEFKALSAADKKTLIRALVAALLLVTSLLVTIILAPTVVPQVATPDPTPSTSTPITSGAKAPGIDDLPQEPGPEESGSPTNELLDRSKETVSQPLTLNDDLNSYYIQEDKPQSKVNSYDISDQAVRYPAIIKNGKVVESKKQEKIISELSTRAVEEFVNASTYEDDEQRSMRRSPYIVDPVEVVNREITEKHALADKWIKDTRRYAGTSGLETRYEDLTEGVVNVAQNGDTALSTQAGFFHYTEVVNANPTYSSSSGYVLVTMKVIDGFWMVTRIDFDGLVASEDEEHVH